MSKKRSDALQALVAERADLDREIVAATELEEEARRESIAARQVLDDRASRRKAIEERRAATNDALRIIQLRDDVSDETVAALAARAAR